MIGALIISIACLYIAAWFLMLRVEKLEDHVRQLRAKLAKLTCEKHDAEYKKEAR